MKKYLSVFFLLLLELNLLMGQEKEDKAKNLLINGNIKVMQGAYFNNKFDSFYTSGLIHNRINMKYSFLNSFYISAEARNRLLYGESVRMNPAMAIQLNEDDGYADLSIVPLQEKEVIAVMQLDRLLVNYASKAYSITLGRQRINWGVATLWNPNDIFNAYNFLDFDYEERPGVDAIRIQFFSKNNYKY